MMNAPTSIAIDHSNAQQVLIEQSQQTTVFALIFSPSQPESQTLLSTLEKAFAGQQDHATLATIDVNEQAMIAQQLGVQSVPSLMVLKQGQPIDMLVYPQEAQRLDALLDNHLPKSWDIALSQANTLINDEKHHDALNVLLPAQRDAQAANQPSHDLNIALAQCYIALNQLDDAQALLDAIPLANQHTEAYAKATAALTLKQSSATSPEITTLENELANEPDNLQIQYDLALAYHKEQQLEKSLDLLLSILKKDSGFADGNAKQTMLAIFKTLGNQNPLTIKYQRALFAMMY